MKKILVSLVLVFALFFSFNFTFAGYSAQIIDKNIPKISIGSNAPNIVPLNGGISLSITITDFYGKNLPLDKIRLTVTDKNGNDASKFIETIELYKDLENKFLYGPIDSVISITNSNFSMKYFTINGKNNISSEFILDIYVKKNVKNVLPLKFNIFEISTGGQGYQGEGILGKHIFLSPKISNSFFGKNSDNSSWVKELNEITGKNLSKEEYYKSISLNSIITNKILKKIPEGLEKKLKENFPRLHFKSIDLSYNKIKDVKAIFVFDMGLEKLNLSRNNINKIPSNWSLLALKTFDISNNNLKDFPEDLLNSGELEYLDMGSYDVYDGKNNIEYLPKDFGKLKKLKKFYFANNNLKILPISIGKCRKLEELRLYGNGLRKLPNTIGDLKKLKLLSLNYNFLNEIPSTIGNLKNLERLYLGRNGLIKLPDSLINLKKLTDLDLEGNKQLGNLAFDFKSKKSFEFRMGDKPEDFQVKKCQDNITISGKRMCIDSTGDKIKITIEEKNNNTKIIKLTDSLKNKLDGKIEGLMYKLNNKYSSVDKRIKKLQTIISKINFAINKYPKYKEILDYINQQIEEEIILYRAGLY